MVNNNSRSDVLIFTEDELNTLDILINKALGEGLMDEYNSGLLADISKRIDDFMGGK